MSEEFKVGDRVEWCIEGRFSEYEKSTNTDFHDFGTVTQVEGGLVWADWDGAKENLNAYIENVRKAPDKEPKPPFRWLVTVIECDKEFAGDKWKTTYESTPVLQYWNGSDYVDVPVEKVQR